MIDLGIPGINESKCVTNYAIFSDGIEIPKSFQVLSIVVTREVNRIPLARFQVVDGEVAKRDFEVSNTDFFKPGKFIEIQAGSPTEKATIFEGIVIKHNIRIRPNGESVLFVECRDEAIKMSIGRKNKYFEEVKDSELMDEIIGTYNLTREIEDTTVTHKEIVQYNVTDWDFIVTRAEVNGQLVMVEDGEVRIMAPDLSTEPVKTLQYGSNLFALDAEMDARHQLAAVKGSSWDPTTQTPTLVEAAPPGFQEQGNLSADDLSQVTGTPGIEQFHSGWTTEPELQNWVDARLLRSRLSKIRGSVRMRGHGDVKPGTMVMLEGIGDRFNGKAYVSGVRHELADGSWFSDIQFGLSSDWFSRRPDILDTPAAGLIPAVNGLQVGKVTQIHEDPDGEDRIKVKLPVIDQEGEGIWARIATLDAGNKRGTFFRPEKDDEVVVGFLHNDPRHAIVMGMLNSSAKPAPETAEEKNPVKGIVTRSGIKLLFDDEKISVGLETPNGNKIKLSDEDGALQLEDENGNKVTLNSDGITLENSANITLKTSGDLNLEGTNVNIKAGANFKAEGSAGAEMSTSAVAVLKGSLVQIN